MIILKKLIKCYIPMIIFFIISLILITLLNYFDVIKNIKIFKLIIPCITVLIGSLKFGKLNKFRGYLSGLYLGISFIILTLIIAVLMVPVKFKS